MSTERRVNTDEIRIPWYGWLIMISLPIVFLIPLIPGVLSGIHRVAGMEGVLRWLLVVIVLPLCVDAFSRYYGRRRAATSRRRRAQ